MESLFFPDVCVACGHATVSDSRIVCSFCLEERLIPSDPDPDLILPEGVVDVRSAWRFDKEGTIQDLLHALKYRGLSKVAFELGHEAARRLGLPGHDLVPVPLHPSRERARGYNQARRIAEGMAARTGGRVVPESVVVRVRRTLTQTGFNLAQRGANMEGVFELRDPAGISGRPLILVDDVFTTGATLFELARCLRQATPESILLATLARA